MAKFASIDSASVTDMRRLFTRLRKASPEVAKETRQKFKAAAAGTLAKARTKQPVDTGELRRKTRVYLSRGVVSIRSRAQHARTSEFGGRVRLWGSEKRFDYPAHPAVLPAAQEDRQKFVNDANKALIEALRKVGFK